MISSTSATESSSSWIRQFSASSSNPSEFLRCWVYLEFLSNVWFISFLFYDLICFVALKVHTQGSLQPDDVVWRLEKEGIRQSRQARSEQDKFLAGGFQSVFTILNLSMALILSIVIIIIYYTGFRLHTGFTVNQFRKLLFPMQSFFFCRAFIYNFN